MKYIITALLIAGTLYQVSICGAESTWRTYKSAYVGSSTLGYNYVSTIAIGHNDVVYFGHYCLQASYDDIDFVSVYDPRIKYGKWSKIYTIKNSGEAIAVDNNNVVFISDFQSWKRDHQTTILTYSGNEFSQKTFQEGYFGGFVSSIVVDKNNIKWISRNNSRCYCCGLQ